MDTFSNTLAAMGSLTGGIEVIAFQELLKSFRTLKTDSVSSFVTDLGTKSWRIACIFLLQYYSKNSKEVISWISFLARLVLYKRRVYSTKEYRNAFAEKVIERHFKEGRSSETRLPLYLETGQDKFIVEYLPLIHKNYIRQLEEEVEELYVKNTQANNKTVYSSFQGVSFVLVQRKVVFPSKNCRKLVEMIESFFEAVRTTKMFHAKGIIINGESGLGKTESINAIVNSNICSEVIKINMTNMFDYTFKVIVRELTLKKGSLSRPCVILFDELDKYLNHMIRSGYSREKASEGEEKISFESFTASYKESFLYDLLHMIETESFTNGVVFMFCANNFETIYEGIASGRHFDFLKTRFMSLQFERCDTEEFKEYLRFLNKQFEGSRFAKKQEELEILLVQLLEMKLTFWDISHLTTEACFDLEKIIHLSNSRRVELSQPGRCDSPARETSPGPVFRSSSSSVPVMSVSSHAPLNRPSVPVTSRPVSIQHTSPSKNKETPFFARPRLVGPIQGSSSSDSQPEELCDHCEKPEEECRWCSTCDNPGCVCLCPPCTHIRDVKECPTIHRCQCCENDRCVEVLDKDHVCLRCVDIYCKECETYLKYCPHGTCEICGEGGHPEETCHSLAFSHIGELLDKGSCSVLEARKSFIEICELVQEKPRYISYFKNTLNLRKKIFERCKDSRDATCLSEDPLYPEKYAKIVQKFQETYSNEYDKI